MTEPKGSVFIKFDFLHFCDNILLMEINEIIDGLVSGQLKSPQTYGESFYILLRITGTGITERVILDTDGLPLLRKGEPQYYKINRMPEEFLSDKFLEACNGIPVLIQHPEDTNDRFLDGINYKDHTVGTIVKAFVKEENEVWGVARILDPLVLNLILNGLNSTSPAISSHNSIREDGLTDEHFDYIDHLALVVDGYWDAYSKKAIQIDEAKNNIKGGSDMPNEELDKKVDNDIPEEDKKVDNGDKIDALISKVEQLLTALTSKTDNAPDLPKDEKVDNEDEEDKKVDNEEEEVKKVDNDIKEEEKKVDNEEEEKKVDNNIEKIIPKADSCEDKKEKVDNKEEEEVMNVADEEEKGKLVDSAIALGQSYADMKTPKLLSSDTKTSYLRRILLSNRDKVDSKYIGLIDRLAGSQMKHVDYAIGMDAYNSIKKNLLTKKQKAYKPNEARVERYSDRTVYHNVI